MPLTLENFVAGDPGNSLRENDAREAYRKLSDLLSRAQSALVRLAHDPEELERFQMWFGPSTPAVKQTVTTTVRRIHDAVVLGQMVFRNGGAECRANDYAYVYPHHNNYKVYLCNQFFVAGPAQKDSAVGTIIHELSHKTANTLDHAYGQVRCRGLALTQQHLAITNADSYQYYCESFRWGSAAPPV